MSYCVKQYSCLSFKKLEKMHDHYMLVSYCSSLATASWPPRLEMLYASIPTNDCLAFNMESRGRFSCQNSNRGMRSVSHIKTVEATDL